MEVNNMKESYEYWYDQGSSLADSKNYVEAIAAYTKALEVDVSDYTTQYQQRVQIWQTITSLNLESDDFQVWLQYGLILSELGGYEHSLTSFKQALNIEPNCVTALYHQSHSFLQLKYFVEAITNYCRILEISPDYPKLDSLEIAIKELRKDKFGILCQEPLEIQPEIPFDSAGKFKYDDVNSWNHSYASIVQGNEYLQQKDYQKAVESYKKIERFVSCGLFIGHTTRYWNIVAWNNHGVALHHIGHFEEAVLEYKKAATSYGSFPKAWYNQGVALESLGCNEKAEISYSKALQSAQIYAAAWYRHGIVLEKLGQRDEVLENFRNALYISRVFNNQEIETVAHKDFKRMLSVLSNN